MSWIAAAVIGGAVIGGGTSMLAAGKQASSADKATAGQQAMFQQTQQNLQPWMQSGNYGLRDLNALLGLDNQPGALQAGQTFGQLQQPFGLEQFQQSPAYQFNLQQGQQAIDKSANARGNFYAPQTIQDISKFSQGLASNEFQNAYQNYNQSQQNIWNRLSTISGSGQNAAAGIGGFGANMANQTGANTIGAGNAQAAGLMGVGNAANQAVGQGYNAYLLNQILGQQQSSNVNFGA